MTTEAPVAYDLQDGVATITMDDGKANVMSASMLHALDTALDRAEAAGAVVLLTGRARIFSGGYDTGMFERSRDEIATTLRAGGNLVWRLFGFPRPVVAACNGHAIAQGGFTLLSADVRIGASGAFKIGLNEVVIGLTIPHYGIELSRHRLATPWFHHATTTGALYAPDDARTAGFLDRVVEPENVLTVAREEARRLTTIDAAAHRGTKERVRAAALAAIRAGIDTEFAPGAA
jgi:enoyl-CoA hydratase